MLENLATNVNNRLETSIESHSETRNATLPGQHSLCFALPALARSSTGSFSLYNFVSYRLSKVCSLSQFAVSVPPEI